MKRSRFVPVLGLLVAAGALSSCAGSGYVRFEPPVAQVEVVGVAPGPEFVWIPGAHRWVGTSFVWVPGRWERRPARAVRWEPGRWEHHGSRGWRWHEGRWR